MIDQETQNVNRHGARWGRAVVWMLAVPLLVGLWASGVWGSQSADEQIVLRAYGVPNSLGTNVESKALRRILAEFVRRYPYIHPVTTTGLQMRGVATMDVTPLMQIAGDIAPHVLYVNFRQSDTYVRNKFLWPLDRYIERIVGIEEGIAGGHLMSLEEYLGHLRQGPRYDREITDRVLDQCWEVMRRECPYGAQCPHLADWGVAAEPGGGYPAEHYHLWCFPQGPLVIALTYRKDMFFEAGLPDRTPTDWGEMLAWARKLTNTAKDEYGVNFAISELGWSTMSFLYSAGGLIVERDAEGKWECVFNSQEAVEAYYFVARIFLEPFENKHGKFNSVAYTGDSGSAGMMRMGMEFNYIDQRFFAERDANLYGFGPVALGPSGKRGSEFNSRMTGIYAGIEEKHVRDAAWEYMRFYDGPEARLIRTRTFVEEGYGRYVQPKMLRKAGYHEYIRQVPKQWEETFEVAQAAGVPEPYGTNCQHAYRYVSAAVDQIRTDKEVREAIVAGSDLELAEAVAKNKISESEAAELKVHYAKAARKRIHEILSGQVNIANQKMLNLLTPEQRKKRNILATIVAVVVFGAFILLFRKVFRVFDEQNVHVPGQERGRWEFFRYKWAYLLMIPAVGTIGLWAYYPLARGTLMAFQDYNVRGFSRWVGLDNFANILYDYEFWFALWITIKYAFLYMCFGFVMPIVLAFLLTEVPKGKIFFRTIYYLPAVLTGVVVIFLWKGFYGEYGMINQVLNLFIRFVNLLPGVAMAELHVRWLESPRWALFFCLLPSIWAGMGPGCLTYLAALKTVPDDLYEAADIDGAGIWHKVFHVAVPSIKALILINFIGAMVACMKSGGAMVLAMTGGGPRTPHGETEMLGLHIFWEAFAYLRFGTAVAMAWMLGSLLIGFTVFQMQKLSKMEFKTAQGVK